MNTLNNIKNILGKFQKEELKSLINFLKYHKKNNQDQTIKSVQIINLLIAERKLSSHDVQVAIYGKVNYHAFNKILNRLKDKIYEVLLFDSNLNDITLYGKRNKTI